MPQNKLEKMMHMYKFNRKFKKFTKFEQSLKDSISPVLLLPGRKQFIQKNYSNCT